jgi:hypothetical protein
MPSKKVWTLVACSVLVFAAPSMGGCSSHDDDDDIEVSDAPTTTSSALVSPDPSDDPGAKGTCSEHDHEGHHHHRNHKFKVLDRADGAKDHVITIASLPSDLPDRLITRLHEIDTDGDGAVTKHEVHAWRHAHKHGPGH